MAWFKKPEEGDQQMPNSKLGGRSAPETIIGRPEPRTPTMYGAEIRVNDERLPEVRAAETRVGEAAPRASVLGPTLRFRGELSAQEDLVVQGSVEGSITHTQSLTIGTDGLMKGDIRARLIVIDGKVDGDLYATESILIRSAAKVRGNMFAPRIAIQDGAFFQGQVEMQPSGAAVQEHSARLRQAAANASPAVEPAAVEPMSGII
jgi:cytoskeletal protein CcmA (bactofilin family)